MDSPDLQVKYHKLASEYSKLRAQNQVLKKAIIEEQGKTSNLKEYVKSRDQSFRKAEQEIDSLSFRNQQLTKRLILLQDDLEQLHSKPRKGAGKQGVQTSGAILDHNVYIEELELKIKENARLHAELSDTEAFYKNKVVDLESKLEDSIRNVSKNTESTKSDEQILKNEIKKLETDKIMQEVAVQQKEAEIASLQNKIKSLQLTSTKSSEMSSPNLNKNQPPSNLNINLKKDNAKHAEKISGLKLVQEFVDPMDQLSTGFINFFAAYSDLLKNSSLSQKFINQLTEENKVWEMLSSSYKDLVGKLKHDDNIIITLENLTGLDAVSKSVTKCSTTLRKLLPVLSENLHLKEDQLDTPWRSSLGHFVACWAALTPYLTSLAAHSDGRTVLTSGAVARILTLLCGRLKKMQSTSEELVAAWEILSSQENYEGTILKNLQTIHESLSKISSLFSDVMSTWSEKSSSSSTPSTFSPGTPQNAQPSALSLIYSPDGSWNCGLQDGVQVEDNETSLAQQLAQATSRLTKLEEEREHWRLEYQLLNHKYEKELKKTQLLEERLENLNTSSAKESTEVKSSTSEQHNESFNSSTSLIGEVVGSLGTSEEREKEIRNHFTTRCSHLYMQLSSCTSQAALYQNECESLMRRLAVCEESKITTEQEVEEQRKEASRIQETLATTSRNYEEQISTMSEHLADLNEKITVQADLIEQLKFEIKKKVKK